MQAFKIIILTSVCALAVIFIYQNARVMQLNFLAWSLSMSTSLFLLVILFAGIGLGLLLSFWNGRRKIKSLNHAPSQHDRSNTLLPGRI